MRVALIQMTGTDDPAENIARVEADIRTAAADGAGFVLTPEVVNCISASRTHQNAVLTTEADDPMRAALSALAAELGLWVLAGSIAVKTDDPDGRFANRSLLIGPDGAVAARYDKLHMFDVALSETESYRESAGFRPGDRAVVADAGFARIGLSVCYDLRFAALYRALAQAGAEILTVPAAFAMATGRAHWEPLLRARAIETGCYVLAPGQVGAHAAQAGALRQTWGHSMVVDPWGAVVADGGDAPGIVFADLDLDRVAEARRRVPALSHDRAFAGP